MGFETTGQPVKEAQAPSYRPAPWNVHSGNNQEAHANARAFLDCKSSGVLSKVLDDRIEASF
ncbi:hypothetical protein COR50_20800 [Chitinophaga caeni]|uniref:Uncharacterized protein n=1 Tax=Chitinophaga caeni TaxID=2029983 RepID=A0A291QZP8_9BACT|nr:hypothetical protein COR50_20800 [Chitinophaga caeni]